MKDARDGNRVASITQIDKWLNLIQIKTGSYPLPDGNVLTGALDLWWNEVVYSHMWIIDENISTLIKMNTTPLDPVSESNYVYAVNDKKDTYQIATILENLEANKNIPIISQTYANDGYKAKVVGNHEVNIKIPKDSKIWFTTVPSMIFNPEWSNILNSDSTYHIVDGGQNLPYKTSKNSISKKQTGNEIMKHIRKTQAKIITVDVTEILNAPDTTRRKQKIEEIFWTWGTEEKLPWITSKEALASIWAMNGNNEIVDTQILTQAVENIIIGGSVSTTSTYTSPKTKAICWTANKSYASTESSFWSDTFCSVWTLEWEEPLSLPEQWESINWTCISPDGWINANCSATKLNPDQEIKECSWKPVNSKYYNSKDAHEVTVNFGSSTPTPNYAETPNENSCDYTCVDWYTHESWECKDKTPPTGWNFTINGTSDTPPPTNSTTVTLTITCPTDAAGSIPIQMYISWDITWTPDWEACTINKSITLTPLDWEKTIDMVWKDSAENTTTSVKSRKIILNTNYFSWAWTPSDPWIKSDWNALRSCQEYNLNAITKNNWITRLTWICWDWTKACLWDWVYYIAPDLNQSNKFPVYCDMNNDWWWLTLVMRWFWWNTSWWATIWDLNLQNSYEIWNTFKFSDSKINNILWVNSIFIIKTDGTYTYKWFFKKSTYNHLWNISTLDKWESYTNSNLSTVLNTWDTWYANWCWLTDIKYSSYWYWPYVKNSILLNATGGVSCNSWYWWIWSTDWLKQWTFAWINIQVWIK